jgi:hypothetical protein
LLLPYFIILIIIICIAATNIQNFVSGCLERFSGKGNFFVIGCGQWKRIIDTQSGQAPINRDRRNDKIIFSAHVGLIPQNKHSAFIGMVYPDALNGTLRI